jgi:transcription initiation factor TFIID subunit TAF12
VLWFADKIPLLFLQVWLAEFTRLMEQRPTSSQLQQQLAKQQQQCEQQALLACKQAAASAAETAAARGVAAALEGEGFSAQLKVLEMRVETLEEGMLKTGTDCATSCGQRDAGTAAAATAAARPAAPAVYAMPCASQDASAAATAGVLLPSSTATSAALGAAITAHGPGQLALLLLQVGDVQLQLLSKADKVEPEQQLLSLRHALQDAMQAALA